MTVASGGTDISSSNRNRCRRDRDRAGDDVACTKVKAQSAEPVRQVREICAEVTAAALLSQQRCGCNHESDCGCVCGGAGAESNRSQCFNCASQPCAVAQHTDVPGHDLADGPC